MIWCVRVGRWRLAAHLLGADGRSVCGLAATGWQPSLWGTVPVRPCRRCAAGVTEQQVVAEVPHDPHRAHRD